MEQLIDSFALVTANIYSHDYMTDQTSHFRVDCIYLSQREHK